MSISGEREQCNSTITSPTSSKYFRTPLCTFDLQHKEEVKRQLTCHQTVSKKHHSIPINLTLITMVKPWCHIYLAFLSAAVQRVAMSGMSLDWLPQVTAKYQLVQDGKCNSHNGLQTCLIHPEYLPADVILFTTGWRTQVEHQKEVKPRYGEHQGVFQSVNFYRFWQLCTSAAKKHQFWV